MTLLYTMCTNYSRNEPAINKSSRYYICLQQRRHYNSRTPRSDRVLPSLFRLPLFLCLFGPHGRFLDDHVVRHVVARLALWHRRLPRSFELLERRIGRRVVHDIEQLMHAQPPVAHRCGERRGALVADLVV
eukprot:139080-Prymnesium_polylepis.2